MKERVLGRELQWENKITFFVLQLCYIAILNVESHCSSIVFVFTIVTFYNI